MFAEFYAAGGIWMAPITLWGIVAAVFIVLQVAKRERDFRLMIWGAFGLMLLFGALGVVVGLIEAFTAIVAAPVEMREQLVRQSLAIALNPLAWSLLCVAGLAQVALPLTWWIGTRRHLAGVERHDQLAA
jgi:hypothetical protein